MSKKVFLVVVIILMLCIPANVLAGVAGSCIAGKWNWPSDGYGRSGTMTLSQNGDTVSGTASLKSWTGTQVDKFTGKFTSSNKVTGTYTVNQNNGNYKYSGPFTFSISNKGKTIKFTGKYGTFNDSNTLTMKSASKCK